MRSALLAIPLALLAACGHAPEAATSIPPPPGRAARGGSLVIDREHAIAWAADADNQVIHRVDLVSLAVTTHPVEGMPEQIVTSGDRLAVTLRDRNVVALFDVTPEGAIEPVAEAHVPCDPFGLALTPQHEILVTSAFCHAVTALDESTLDTIWSVDVAREPRAVLSTPDGTRAYVTHVVGDSLTALDLGAETPTPRRIRALGGVYRNRVDQAIGAGTLHPSASLAYSAVLSESGSRLFVPHLTEQNGASTTRSIPGAYGGVPVEEETSFASVAVLSTHDEHVAGGDVSASRRETLDKVTFVAPDPSLGFVVAPEPARCRQARAAAMAGDRLFVASQGTGELFELDARALDPAMSMRRRFNVGIGPKGVDVDRALGVAVVWSQLSHEIAVVSLGSGAVERRVIASDPLPPALSKGRKLFTTELDRRISRDGRACASCHPDGREDGLVWKLGAGPRQTPMLVGRLDRGPYAWQAKHDRLQDNMRETMGRLGGAGLSEAELDDLAAYLQKGLIPPAREARPLDALARRGRALFTSEAVGCSGCHRLDMEASDRSLHDVGSRSKTDTASTFRTPPLLYVGYTAPYFHDGRYQTLEQLLDDNLDRMGQTTHLSRDDLRAIAAFLRTL
ncbi:Putative Methylamine utilization protein mauG [Minicystis rosea]|nr:Putative Methylamine utilization protein mauG [Minicystis rosea]